MKQLSLKLFWGLCLGFVISRIGFVDFEQVHHMFLLSDFRMFFSFAFAATLMVAYFLTIGKGVVIQKSDLHPGIIPGSILFGLGWALTGGCPAVVLAQIGHGSAGALLTLAGISAGMILYRQVHSRHFNWATASCDG